MEFDSSLHYPASEAEWDALRPEIERLYIHEGLTLKALKDEIATKHHLKAT